jgi:hypothetical protein
MLGLSLADYATKARRIGGQRRETAGAAAGAINAMDHASRLLEQQTK